jgi:hypothetical protein
MPDQHNKNFRVGKTEFYIQVFQSINPISNEWIWPSITIPRMTEFNIQSALAAVSAILKAVVHCRNLQKYIGRPAL